MTTQLPREWTLIDNRRRITIPPKFIKALGITPEQLQTRHPILIEAYPTLENCKTLIIKNGATK